MQTITVNRADSKAILAAANAYKSSSSSVNRSTSVSSVTLSPKFVAASQALSNKYGVATFDTKGKILTVPTVQSGGFSNIDVGIGAYRNFDSFANAAVQKALDQEKSSRDVGGGITLDNAGNVTRSFNADDPIIIVDPTQPTRYVDVAASADTLNPILTNKSPGQQGASLADQAKDLVSKYGIWVGAGLGLLLILKMTKVIK